MTSTLLANLAKIGQLDAVPASPELVQRILAAARQQLKDAHLEQASKVEVILCPDQEDLWFVQHINEEARLRCQLGPPLGGREEIGRAHV